MKFKEFRYMTGMFVGVMSFLGWLNYKDDERRKALASEIVRQVDEI